MPCRRLVLAGLLSIWACLPAYAQGQGQGASNGGSGNGSSAGNGNGNSGNSNNGNDDKGNDDKGNGDKGNGNNRGGATESNLGPGPLDFTEPLSKQPRMRLRHGNGFEETLSGGRYHMKDNQGRTIVERPATQADLARMRYLTGS